MKKYVSADCPVIETQRDDTGYDSEFVDDCRPAKQPGERHRRKQRIECDVPRIMEAVDGPILEENSRVPVSVEQLIESRAKIGDPELPAEKRWRYLFTALNPQ